MYSGVVRKPSSDKVFSTGGISESLTIGTVLSAGATDLLVRVKSWSVAVPESVTTMFSTVLDSCSMADTVTV